jgi:hypothetical protein
LKGKCAGLVLLACSAAACAGPAAFEERLVHLTRRVPLVVERVAIPGGTRAVAAWVATEGDGIVALGDGRMLAVDARGAVRPIDRPPGEAPRADEAPVARFGERAPGSPLAIVPGGALIVERGFVQRAPLPAFLASPRAFARLGSEALWATPDGLFASHEGRWFGLETSSGPLSIVTDLAPIDRAPEAWVQAGAVLCRVRVDGGASPRVTWIDAAKGINLGAVRAIARVDGARAAVMSTRGVAVAGPDRIRLFHGKPEDGLPEALGGGGGYAWVGWAGQILRTDGERWEALASGVALGPAARIAVDGGTGAIALVVDAKGNVFRFEAEAALHLSGISDGEQIIDTRLELEVLPPRSRGLATVAFSVDGKPLAMRDRPPWGWGEGGARVRDLKGLSFGPHRIEAVARDEEGHALERSIRIAYTSPLRRIPTYDKDIAPIYAAHCARCHSNGIAHELGGYDALAAERSLLRAAVREARMPPDILLDRVSTAVITAWVDGDTPK